MTRNAADNSRRALDGASSACSHGRLRLSSVAYTRYAPSSPHDHAKESLADRTTRVIGRASWRMTWAIAAISIAMTTGLSIARPPSGARGTVVVPETFLRAWDPVTIFFESNLGPAEGGPEDRPQRFVSMDSDHPGAFTWLDAKTLQFVPAEPWNALTRVKVRPVNGKTVSLATLMNPPTTTIPRNRAENLQPLEAITLTFPEPIPATSLAAMTTIELRPRPGLDGDRARWLDQQDFVVKAMERSSPSSHATYVLQLSEPIPESSRAIVHFRLSLDDTHEASFAQFSFSTLDAFRLLSFGCSSRLLPVTPDGTTYSAEQAVACPSGQRRLQLVFSSEAAATDAVVLNNLIRLTPSVEGLKMSRSGRVISVTGPFEVEKRYELSAHPTRLVDGRGRSLDMRGPSRMSFFFPRQPKFLSWTKSHGVVERFGPKMVPLSGRGFDRVDLRIHRVDGLDRRWWPFGDRPIGVDESVRPPGPGEEPEVKMNGRYRASPSTIRALLHAKPDADLSRIVELPTRRDGSGASFGLDLTPHLDHLDGARRPGTYLVGIRRIDGSHERSWMRIQVTDLALSVIEEPRRVHFYVTSLRTGLPVAGARVRVEGSKYDDWTTFHSGQTNADGAVTWTPPGLVRGAAVRRIVVEQGQDRLVLDPSRPPERFERSRWRGRSSGWLSWTINAHLEGRGEKPKDLCHLFTERPVYRPDEKVFIKGYVRRRHKGVLERLGRSRLKVNIRGSGDLTFDKEVELTKIGSFDTTFEEDDLPTGVYVATLQDHKKRSLCSVSFKMEAYRIPKFEVRLNGADTVPLDGSFTVDALASYYAGGPVAGRPLRWRVTQFPYEWSPSTTLPGYFYSTDARFSRRGAFRSTPNLGRTQDTDETGGASLELNPALEATGQPRKYVVEATVTGADDQTVTATKQVRALPPFALGLKVPRFIESAKAIRPNIIAVDSKGKTIANQEVTVRLIHRTWHSHLQASNFADGAAKYITDVVDTPVSEQKISTKTTPVSLSLPISTGGVYVVELVSRDRLGRAQTVAVDLYAGGGEAMSWRKPEEKVFDVSTDKTSYAPGETATYLVKSPFQNARVLVVVESPAANRYRWLDVKGGVATYRHVVQKNEVPRLPVHFVLMRGRLESGPAPTRSGTDLSKPATMASTKWIEVEPVEHRLLVGLEHAKNAQPGQTLKMKITLHDHAKRARGGEVTLWLVDQAVLALAKEQPLDPLPAFITPTKTYASVTDSRNDVFGHLPFAENPGGDGPEDASESNARGLLDKVTVRKNFKTVPVFLPRIAVPKSGVVEVDVPLPDNLTNFMVRAKAVSGDERFGFAKSMVSVRLPVIVQPAMPRFVRSGDRLSVGGIARVVEGEGGAGGAEIAVTNARLEGKKARATELVKNRPTSVRYPIEVSSPEFPKSADRTPRMKVTLGVVRNADGAKDAFQVAVPIRRDRRPERRRLLKVVRGGEVLNVPAVKGPVRAGTAKRSILISDEASLVMMASALDSLITYPHGNTEARISRARAFLASKSLRNILHMKNDTALTKRVVKQTLEWIASATSGSGRVAQWPGAKGYVWLTAEAVHLMLEARDAGYTIDDAMWNRSVATLERALRSDYRGFITGESWGERVASLEALTRAGKANAAYAAELANKSNYLPLESIAGVAHAFTVDTKRNEKTLDRLQKRMWDGIVLQLHQGREIYGGLQKGEARSALVLPSETRTLARVVTSLDRIDPQQPKLSLLVDALVTLGRDDGWGTTNANAAALIALAERLGAGKDTAQRSIAIRGGKGATLRLGPKAPIVFAESGEIGAQQIVVPGDGEVVVRIETTYVPGGHGSAVEKASRGFVVSRRHLVVNEGRPSTKRPITEAGQTLEMTVSDVVEEHVQIVNPKDRHYVAITVPLSAGMEPLNPRLATSPPEAKPSKPDSESSTHLAFLDDRVTYYFDVLPKGTYDFYVRTRASTAGTFTQPPARAEMMYDATVVGHSPAAKVVIERKVAP